MINSLVQKYNSYRKLLRDIRYLAANTSAPSLQQSIAGVKNAQSETRQRFGRAISMDRIESALRSAHGGSMSPITDLSRETIDTDPHLCSVLFKRFGAVTTLPIEILPATGPGVDKERAKYFASVSREHVLTIPHLRQRLLQLSWALFDNRAAHEINWRVVRSAGSSFGRVSIAPRGLDWIHPRRLNYGPRRELCVLDEGQRYGGSFSETGLSLNPEDLRKRGLHLKFMQWTPSLFGEYQEREGLGPRALYWSFFKRYAQRERMILIELFGKPWRIIEVDENSDASNEDLEAADNAADQLGGSSSGRMPRGVHLRIESPDAKSSENHRNIIEDSDRQISKLVLGQTGTTDPNPAGINNSQADVMQDEQAVVTIWDATTIGEIATNQLIHTFIEANFGADELSHAPRIVLRWDRPSDRGVYIDRLKRAMDTGIEVALTEAYESTGFRQPEPDEPVVRIEQPPQVPGSGNAPLPRPVIVYPRGTSPQAGEQQPPAETASTGDGSRETEAAIISTADLAKVTTVNEARAAQNLPPLTLPDGSLDPDGDLTILEFESKKTTAASGGMFSNHGVSRSQLIEKPTLLTMHYDSVTGALGADVADRIFTEAHAGEIEFGYWYSLANSGDDVRDHRQPKTGNGNPEEIIDRGLKELTRETGKWSDQFSSGVKGLVAAGAIYAAINRIGEGLDTQPYGRALERRMLHTAALGALDSNLLLDGMSVGDFAKLPFQKAMQIFRQKDIVTKSVWNTLEAEAKRKAFTVAGLQSRAMLQTIHGELARQIGQGADLREFSKFMTDRLKSAGMIGQIQSQTGVFSASHVETVFRTNALNSYGAGRYAHMSQPTVVKVRPVWGISGIGDRRSRQNHRDAHGKYLYASDPFWQRAYPPFGFNCRCRVTSHALTRDIALTVTPGTMITYLPDSGFISGVGNLLR